MSSISELLAQILGARYGKDVRQSIHDAIEKIDEIAEGAEESAAASAELAEGSAETAKSAKDRCEEVLESIPQDYSELSSKVVPATTDGIGLVKPDGSTITVDADGTIHGASSYELPTASQTTLGGVKVDGSTITVAADGTISGNAQPDIATTSAAGIVKPDGSTITVNSSGLIKAANATSESVGIVKPDGESTFVDLQGTIMSGCNSENLAVFPRLDSPITVNGITFTLNKDGSVSFGGYCTSSKVVVLNTVDNPIILEEEELYTISSSRVSNISEEYVVSLGKFNSSGEYDGYYNFIDVQSRTITADNSKYAIGIQIYSGEVYDSNIKLMLEKGEEAHSFVKPFISVKEVYDTLNEKISEGGSASIVSGTTEEIESMIEGGELEDGQTVMITDDYEEGNTIDDLRNDLTTIQNDIPNYFRILDYANLVKLATSTIKGAFTYTAPYDGIVRFSIGTQATSNATLSASVSVNGVEFPVLAINPYNHVINNYDIPLKENDVLSVTFGSDWTTGLLGNAGSSMFVPYKK